MKLGFRNLVRIGGTFSLAFVVGCASVRTPDVHQFEPVPTEEVQSDELAPVASPDVGATRTTELLREAGDAFAKGNELQEKGEEDAALQQYSRMLRLLQEAKLDPAVYYGLRPEFERILRRPGAQTGSEDPTAGATDMTQEELSKLAAHGDLEIPFPIPEAVLDEIEEIQQLYPKNFQRGLDRHYKYVDHLRREFALAGLPQDLVWLAMVESQFHPKVVSRAGAAGMWQFMRSTGKRFGLRIDSYVDERFSWRRETGAAIAYVTELRDRFNGQWPLAISSYNMGEGGMDRVIASNGGNENIWELIQTDSMPRETRKFYSKLLATVIVGSNPEKYGFKSNPQPAEECDIVTIKGTFSLAAINSHLGFSSGTLEELNPNLIKGVTPPGDGYPVVVPKGTGDNVLASLDRLPKFRPDVHVVQAGETPSGIAKKYKVSARDLMAANKIRSPRQMQVGKRLVIPGSLGVALNESSGKEEEPSQAAGPASTYRVRRGDSLSRIASAHGVSIGDLQRWNNLGRRTQIHVGSTIKVSEPGKAAPAKAVAPAETVSDSEPETIKAATPEPAPAPEPEVKYSVKAGDCPALIAQRHGVSLDDLLKWNGLTKKSTIKVGDKLTVRGSSATASSASSAPAQAKVSGSGGGAATYTVAPGDSASVIASKHGIKLSDLLKWNGLTSKSVLKVGQKLVVRAGDGATAPAESKGEVVMHKVTSGQNPTTIAKKHGVSVNDLYEWNGWSKNHVLHVGDEVKIHKK